MSAGGAMRRPFAHSSAGAARDQRLDVRAEAVARGQAVGEERIDRLLVQDPDVIRLEEGVDDQLPVRRVLGADGAEVGEAARRRRTAARRRGRRARRRRRSSRRASARTQSRPCRSSAGSGDQVGVFGAAGVEGFGMEAMAQRAVELVGPAVVRADDAGARLSAWPVAATRRMPRCRQTLRKARKRPSASRVRSSGTP